VTDWPGRAGDTVTVAIPVRNGERYLSEVLRAVRRQRLEGELELLIVDSGSTDRSLELARDAGARVVEITRSEFSHGGTRNKIMELAKGERVAFLTQDATPADERWLARLLEGFELADDVALVFGPYLPRPGASHMVQREFRDFFATFAPDARPVVQRLSEDRKTAARYRRGPSPLTFFTDANGCVARWAWERVAYRDIAYAEDQLLASEMIEAGLAKVFHPGAGVYHSHDYGPVTMFRRCFDEWRGLREVYGHVESAAPKRVLKWVFEETAADVAFLGEQGSTRRTRLLGGLRSLAHHTIRMLGALTGSRADRLPRRLRAILSLEGEADFRSGEVPS
jgi:glycosyltransferase involved in cell wall biosynthesis